MDTIDNSTRATLITIREEITAAFKTAAAEPVMPENYRPAVVVQAYTAALVEALASYDATASDALIKLVKAELKKVPAMRVKPKAADIWCAVDSPDTAGETVTAA